MKIEAHGFVVVRRQLSQGHDWVVRVNNGVVGNYDWAVTAYEVEPGSWNASVDDEEGYWDVEGAFASETEAVAAGLKALRAPLEERARGGWQNDAYRETDMKTPYDSISGIDQLRAAVEWADTQREDWWTATNVTIRAVDILKVWRLVVFAADVDMIEDALETPIGSKIRDVLRLPEPEEEEEEPLSWEETDHYDKPGEY